MNTTDVDSVASEGHEDRRVERRFVLWLSPLVLLVSVLKGLDGISYWPATQALVDYRFGLVKRGLIGAVLSHPLHFEKLAHFYIFSLAVLAVLLGLLLAFALFGGLRERFSSHLLLPLYFSSYAISYLAYCLGYNDAVLLCLVIPLLFIRNSTTRLLLCLPVAVVCVLVQETFLVMLLPLLLLSFLLETTLTEYRATQRALLIKASVLALLTLGGTVRIALRPSLTPTQIAQLRSDSIRRADFPPNEEVFVLMGRSAGENVRLLIINTQLPYYWRKWVGSMLTMFPNIVLLCIAIAVTLRSVQPTAPRWLVLCCFEAALFPLALHLIAWDVDRWNAQTITNSFLVLVLICRFTQGSVVSLSPRLRYLVLFLIVFNISIRAVVLELREIEGARPWLQLHSKS